MTTVEANGLKFHVNRFRTGAAEERPVVVCVHGLAVVDNAASSFLLGFQLAKEADVVSYDLRGHGRSDRPPTGYRINDHAADLLALLDALEIDQPIHLVGSSYGGAVVSAAAMTYPERLASLILLDGLVPIAGWESDLRETIGSFEVWLDEARSTGVSDGEIDGWIAAKVMEEYGATRRRAVGVTRRVRVLFENTSLRDDIRSEVTFPDEAFGQITCPVLGVYGDKSRVYRMVDLLPRLCPDVDVTMHTLPGADHLDVFWRIQEYRHVIRRFVGLPEQRS